MGTPLIPCMTLRRAPAPRALHQVVGRDKIGQIGGVDTHYSSFFA